MSEEIKNLLDEEIMEEIRNLSSLEAGSKEKSSAVEDLAKLYKLRTDESKAEWDYSEKYESRLVENEKNRNEADLRERQRADELETIERERLLKERQLADQAIDRYFRIGAEAAGILLPLIFYAIWMRKGFKFEETGTYTSTTFKGLFNRFRPVK